jgi:CubicO group peptidase (beta-lactamase class C family)
MKYMLHVLMTFGLTVPAFTALGCSDDATKDPQLDHLRTEVRQRLDAAATQAFSGAVLVTARGETLLAGGHGLADRGNDVPNTVDTAFDFGSVMKDLTAAAIFKLESEGKLSIDAPLTSVLDGVPADKAEITILQVLQHRAGFQEYHDTEGDFESMTQLQARERIFEQELLFDPGSDEAYSNAGYTLLADIVQTTSGEEFTAYMHDEFFTPAGMEHTGFFGEPLWEQFDTAIGYEASTFDDNDPASWPYTWALVGNGGLVTTVGDLERWLLVVRQGGVLEPSAFAVYEEHYLHGAAAELEGETVYGFAGAGDFGLGGVALDCPEQQSRVILGTNTYETFDVETFAVELAELVLSAQ